jgi:ParB-like chromosome segregation protein Spo0J
MGKKKDTAVKGLDSIVLKASALQRLVIEYVPIDSIKPNAYNPNRQDEKEFQMLQESMSEDGFTQPIVVQQSTREIVDGEHRWRAGRAQGMATVPVVFVNMSQEQMRISTLRHNRARGAEDQELVTQVLKDLRELGALGWAQDALQISDEDLNVLINDVPVSEALAGEAFSEGWSPVRNLKEGTSEKSDVRMHSSVAEMNRELNERLAKAASPEERQAIEAERRAKTYRVSVVFNAEDAALVKEVLGGKPVETLLACCSAYERLHGTEESAAE